MPLTALYDLRVRPATFDFFNWLVDVRHQGAAEVVLQVREINARKFTVEESRKRVANFLLPGPALAGLPVRLGDDGDCDVGTHAHGAIAGQPYRRLASVYDPHPDVRFTVTLRQTFHQGWRNSDIPVWREFAERIGAIVIEDDMIRPIGLLDRVALYAGARMNYGVVNGPMSLCSMTPYPCTIYADPEHCLKGMSQHSVGLGENYGHVLPGQRLIWLRPRLADMLKQHAAMGF